MLVELRSVESDDADFLLAVFLSSRSDLQTLPAPLQQLQCDLQFRDYSSNYGTVGHAIILIDGRTAGRVWTCADGGSIRIVDIALLPEYRRQGAGGIVLSGILAESQEVFLTVRKDNPALRLYRRLGFRVTASDELEYRMTWRRETREG